MNGPLFWGHISDFPHKMSNKNVPYFHVPNRSIPLQSGYRFASSFHKRHQWHIHLSNTQSKGIKNKGRLLRFSTINFAAEMFQSGLIHLFSRKIYCLNTKNSSIYQPSRNKPPLSRGRVINFFSHFRIRAAAMAGFLRRWIFLQYFRQVCNIVTIHDISKNAQLKWWKTCIRIYEGVITSL